jgi:hypothetical protein
MVLLNLYGPYDDSEDLWSRFFSLDCLNSENLICGRDLKITLGRDEIWGP